MAKATTIRELLVKLGVKADTKNVSKFDAALAKAKSGMAATAMVAAGLTAAIAATAASFLGLSANVAKIGDDIGKAAARVGVTAEEFQVLSFAAGEAGVSVEQLEDTLKTQSIAMANASKGAATQVDALRAVGLSFEGASKLDQFELFKRVSDGLLLIEDQSERTSATVALFGEVGTKLGPLLKGGSDGIDAAAMAAENLGIILDDESIAATERYTDAMGRLTGSFSAFKNKVGIVVIEALLPIVDAINDFTSRNQRLINVLVDLTPMVLALVTAIAGLAAIGVVLASLGFLVSGIMALTAAVELAAASIGLTLLPFIGALALAFVSIAAQVALGVAVFGAVGLAIDDLLTFIRGGDSLIGRFIDRWKGTDGVMGTVARSTESMIGIFVELFAITKDLASVAFDLFEAFGAVVLVGIEATLGAIVDLLGQVFGFDASPLLGGFESFESVIDSILGCRQAISGMTWTLSGLPSGLGDSITSGGFSALGDAAKGAASSVYNSVSQSVTNQITGTDPVRIGEEVRRAMDVQHRRAAEVLAGGVR